jgi:hypothetical protein
LDGLSIKEIWRKLTAERAAAIVKIKDNLKRF